MAEELNMVERDLLAGLGVFLDDLKMEAERKSQRMSEEDRQLDERLCQALDAVENRVRRKNQMRE